MASIQTTQERREFSRIEVYIPFEFRLVPEEEQPLVNSRISGELVFADFQQMPPLDNRPQLAWVNLLNGKLDSIIQRLMLQYQGFHSLPFKYVTISGSGMNFSAQHCFSLGDILEVKMMLTLYKPAAFYIYGEVVKVQKQMNGYLVAISFQMTDDTIRDRIIQFVFEMERELLRERRNTE